jgi:hypothetical protein
VEVGKQLGRGESGDSYPIIDEQGGAQVVPGPGKGGLSHPWVRSGQPTYTYNIKSYFFNEP